MPVPTFIAYVDTRLFEWAKSLALITMGIAMLIWPKMAHGSILQLMVGLFGGSGTAVIFVLIGLFGIAALIANGRSMAYGPWTRSAMASARSIIWTTFTLSMVRVSIEQGFPSPMVFFFGIFTVVELYIAYRAVLDVRAN